MMYFPATGCSSTSLVVLIWNHSQAAKYFKTNVYFSQNFSTNHNDFNNSTFPNITSFFTEYFQAAKNQRTFYIADNSNSRDVIGKKNKNEA